MKLFILSISIVLLLITSSFADDIMQLPVKDDVHYLRVDIDRDGVEEEISTILASSSWETEIPYICTITIKDGKETTSLAIPIDMSFYNISVVDIAPEYINPFIGLDYHCGAHSRVLILLEYTDYHYMGVANKPTLETTAYFSSDRPLFKIEDVDGNKIKEIITENCDYEINPVNESFISTYKYIDEYISDPDVQGSGRWERILVYRTATKENMPADWDKDNSDVEAFKENMKKFDMYKPED